MIAMNIISVCAVSIFSVVCGVSLKKYAPEITALMITSAVVMTAVFMIPYLSDVIYSIGDLAERAYIKSEYMIALVKSIGICLLTQITSDICRENGGHSLATQTEICGRIAILMIAYPLYTDLFNNIIL